ncbi:M48 family metalloprotease [Diaphorobacter aerolatus]|uniref:Peptidase M48 n=1 Tax=Diaphorobacter aerolatus TaxID=1288495 RepID=A0A7H0GNB9_9BURK|nr:hypothetical protein [Diaphorobacter aerolatus]QNP49785.1 hypothetical protein H9K75_07675 [Diaphorobacter aerolatus]
MEYADFVHLARRSEQQCAEDSRAYRRRVVWFAALGYLWVVGCAALAIGILAFCLPQLISGRFRFAWVMMTLTGFGLLWVSLQALWVRIEPPEGERISRDEAPELFKALERIQHKIKGPPIHEVYLNDEFNASVRQVPRWACSAGRAMS